MIAKGKKNNNQFYNNVAASASIMSFFTSVNDTRLITHYGPALEMALV